MEVNMSFVYNIINGLSKLTASYKQPYPDIHMLDFRIVNSFIIGNVQMRKYDWVIVDAGIDSSGRMIVRTGKNYSGQSASRKRSSSRTVILIISAGSKRS